MRPKLPRRSTADSFAIGRELYRQEQLAKARRELAETPPLHEPCEACDSTGNCCHDCEPEREEAQR